MSRRSKPGAPPPAPSTGVPSPAEIIVLYPTSGWQPGQPPPSPEALRQAKQRRRLLRFAAMMIQRLTDDDPRLVQAARAALKELALEDHGPEPGATAGDPPSTPPFFLQVGAFVELDNAERLRARLLANLRDVHVSPADSNGQAVYRVRVGPFTDVVTSDQVVRQLQQLGVDQHRVVTD